MFSGPKRNKQAGFSLLETTASIVLLSTVAATALPKLEALEEQAQTNGERYVAAAEDRAEQLTQLEEKYFPY